MRKIKSLSPLVKFFALTLMLAIAALSYVTIAEPAFAQDRTSYETSTTTTSTDKMRTVAPEKAHMVILNLKAAGGSSETTCCTHWNTSTGGTGCASFPDSCPAGQFEVNCGANGCW